MTYTYDENKVIAESILKFVASILETITEKNPYWKKNPLANQKYVKIFQIKIMIIVSFEICRR